MPSCEARKVLAGQKALVTGASSGIGKGVAEVVVNYVSNPGQAEEVVAESRHEGGKAYAHQADVSQEDQVQAMFAGMLDPARDDRHPGQQRRPAEGSGTR